MATAKITKMAVDRAGPGFLWDTDVKGFGLRVMGEGVRSYVFSYRLGGRESAKRRYTIGRHGSPWTPDSARTEALRLSRLVADGIDPIDDDRERRRQAVDLAFSSYVDLFADRYLKLEWGPRWPEVHRLMKREPVDVIGSKPLPKITKADLSAVLDRLSDRPAVQRHSFAALRKLFRWAVSRGDIDRSPMEGMAQPSGVPSRDRVLDDTELALAWQAAAGLSKPFDAFFRLLILTGQRRDEVASLRWSELDRDGAEWCLPASRTKNGVSHIVPLSPMAKALLDDVAGKGEWPRKGFVLSTTGKTPISGFSKAKGKLDASITVLEIESSEQQERERRDIPPWRTHDIRRTVATGLQRLGVRLEVTEAVLNHVSGSRSGIVGVYQRHDWKAEKRAALEAWAEHVAAAVAGLDQ